MPDQLRWGILGTGKIAGKFAEQLTSARRGRLQATGSRRASSAQAFAETHGGAARAGYEALLDDPEVDAVYVSLPNALHHTWSIAALQAGKQVLCEKPIAASREEAAEMFAVAEQTGGVLVEAFMYRCHPAVKKFISLAREGAVGEVRIIRSHFTFQRAADPADVRYQAELAGGSLMDVGSYCINLARAVAGREPTDIRGLAHRSETGVDDFAVGCLGFGEQTMANFSCGMTVQSDRHATIGGSEGYLRMDTPWFSEGTLECVRDGKVEKLELPCDLPLYALEADTFAGVVLDGEPAWISKEDSLGNMAVLDALRRDCGLPGGDSRSARERP